LAVAVSCSSAQDVTLNCTFIDNFRYTCALSGVEVLDPSANITIAGEHLANRTDADVEEIRITNSNTPFMIQQLFDAFPNVLELDIMASNLQSINIPDFVQLRWLYLWSNNLSRIENGTFSNQRQLSTISLTNSGITDLDEDAFVGLESLTSMGFINNQIREILPRTLFPFVNVTYLDFEGNNLTRINEGIFSRNERLSSLYLERNQISEIHPGFSAALPSSVNFINLSENQCINASFNPNNELSRMLLNGSLRPCFNNFVGTPADAPRNITLEFVGPVRLFDEFGNMVANIQ